MSKVKLSVCMIVKNEEQNIATALKSVEDIAFECIVVDTGSTDKTVEAAESMGAKVHHFEWVDDFAAAKNASIEYATGDWILSLDADEYLLPDDAQRLLHILEETGPEPERFKDCLAISFMLVNIDDFGRQMTKSSILRIFRNIPTIRFSGRIHEQLTVEKKNIMHTNDVTLMHTGYSETIRKKTGKAKRNLEMLKAEIKSNPENMTLKAYLANNLSMSTDEKEQKEAETLFEEILGSGKSAQINNTLIIKLYIFTISKYLNDPEKLSESEKMCKKALTAFPNSVDFEYLLAVILHKKGDNEKAWQHLKNCEENLIHNNTPDDAIMIPADPTILFSQMILTAKALGDIETVILYSTHVLTMDKTKKSILGPCIATLLYYGVTEAETIDLLSNIYDFSDNKDLNFIAETAKDYGAAAFAKNLTKLSSN
ncbi:MAG: glycosyltransferase [Oscillospiraceae bacterium]|nr:glycosyltransferase [Oscillospiraceae bacterium]